jgi:hypothetical protein
VDNHAVMVYSNETLILPKGKTLAEEAVYLYNRIQ